MARLVLALAIAALCVVGYRNRDFFTRQPQGGIDRLLAAAPESRPASRDVEQPLAARVPPRDDAVEKILRGMDAREAQAFDDAYAWLAQPADDARRADRQRVSDQLKRVVASAKGAGELLAVLGAKSAFLRSAEGRELGKRLATLAKQEPPESAQETLSRFVEASLLGSIEKGDTEARALVESAMLTLRPLVDATTLNPGHVARARCHKVESGSSLDAIAKRYAKELSVPLDGGTLAFLNHIPDPRMLRSGTVIKIPVEPVRAVVVKASYALLVYVGDQLVRLYWIAHGKDGCTPEVTFTVGEKQFHPDWYDTQGGRVVPYGHPDNPLGDYFVKFVHDSQHGFGVHGTSEPNSIGTMASRGCIRLGDADIREFYALMPRGSRVVVR